MRYQFMKWQYTGSAPYDLKRQYAKVLEQRLRTNPNVGEITKLGYRDLETQILLNPFKLNKHYVSLGEVLLAVQSNNIYSKAGDSKPFPYEKYRDKYRIQNS